MNPQANQSEVWYPMAAAIAAAIDNVKANADTDIFPSLVTLTCYWATVKKQFDRSLRSIMISSSRLLTHRPL